MKRLAPRVASCEESKLHLAHVFLLGVHDYAVVIAAAVSRPSSLMLCSRMMNFWTLPVTVVGKASTNLT